MFFWDIIIPLLPISYVALTDSFALKQKTCQSARFAMAIFFTVFAWRCQRLSDSKILLPWSQKSIRENAEIPIQNVYQHKESVRKQQEMLITLCVCGFFVLWVYLYHHANMSV